MLYERNDIAFGRGKFRVRGDVVEIHATHHQKNGWLRYITHVLVMINRKPFRVLVMIYEYHRRRDS
jgi:excinuclease UvrABC helicase subunit UvrB